LTARYPFLVAPLMLMLLTGLQAPVRAQLDFTPHEEPSTAPNIMDAYSLLSYYADIFRLIPESDYDHIRELLARYNLISLPSNVRSLFGQYTEQTSRVSDEVEEIERLADETSRLLDQNNAQGANQTLHDAAIAIAKAKIQLKDVKSTTVSIGNSLGVPKTPEGSPARMAYAELEGSVQSVEDLIDYYLRLFLAYRERLSGISGQNGTVPGGTNGTNGSGGINGTNPTYASPTSLTLTSNASEVWVGGSVQLSGSLTCNGTGLGGKGITVLFNGESAVSAVTGPDGSYTCLLAIPFLYESPAYLFALYIPSADDGSLYRSSMSEPLVLTLLFNNTSVELVSPPVSYPGKDVTVTGKVTSGGMPQEGRSIRIYLDGSLLDAPASGPDGSFVTTFTIDPSAATGSHYLYAEVSPSGVYAGGSASRTLRVERVPVNVSLSCPPFALIPSTVVISGSAYAGTAPLTNATVTVNMTGGSRTLLAENGSFSVGFELPPSLWIAGYHTVSVSVYPAEPWYADGDAKATIFIVNPVVAAGTAVLAFAGLLFFRRVRRLGGENDSGSGAGSDSGSPAGPVVSQAPADGSAPEGMGQIMAHIPVMNMANAVRASGLSQGRQKVIASYLSAVRSVSSFAGVPMSPDMTLNEFLRAAEPKLNGTALAFRNLTYLAEKSLYSCEAPNVDDLSAADDYARYVAERLGIGGS